VERGVLQVLLLISLKSTFIAKSQGPDSIFWLLKQQLIFIY